MTDIGKKIDMVKWKAFVERRKRNYVCAVTHCCHHDDFHGPRLTIPRCVDECFERSLHVLREVR